MKAWESNDVGNVRANGRNWNSLRLLTGLGTEKAGHRLHSIQFQFKEGSVLIILKKDSPKGPKIAFLEAADLDIALWVAASYIKSKRVPWKNDKWRSTRSDKT